MNGLPAKIQLRGMADGPTWDAVFFLHLSSSGGSSVCRLGQLQACSRVNACRANCNLNCAHPWDWRGYCTPPACVRPERVCKTAHPPSCAGLSRYVRRRNLSIVASETMLPTWHRNTGPDPLTRHDSTMLPHRDLGPAGAGLFGAAPPGALGSAGSAAAVDADSTADGEGSMGGGVTALCPGFAYVTVLRDPVEREYCISNYRYICIRLTNFKHVCFYFK